MRSRILSWSLSAALMAVVAMAPNGVSAASPEDRATARSLARQADEKLASGDLDEAYELLRGAFTLVSAPTLKVGMARIRERQNRLVEAQNLYLDAARSKPEAGEPEQWVEARTAAASASTQLDVQIPTLAFAIEGAELDAVRLSIDGKSVPTVALRVARPLDPGRHKVVAQSEGKAPIEADVNLAKGARESISLRFVRDPLLDFGLSPAAHDAARAHVVGAAAALQRGDSARAVAAYRNAIDVVSAPSLELAVAHAHERLGELAHAHSALLRAASGTPRPDDPPEWVAARATAAQEAAVMGPRVPTLKFHFQGVRQGTAVRVFINGSLTPAYEGTSTYRFNPGSHHIRVEADGLTPAVLDITLREGQQETATVALPVAPAPPVDRAAGDSGAEIPTLAMIGFASAGVFAVAGGALGWVAKSRVDDIRSECVDVHCPPARESDADAARTLSDLSTVSFGLAAVGLVTGGVAWLSAGSSPKTESTARGSEVSVALGLGSVQVGGRF